MYQDDAIAAVRCLARAVRLAGWVVFEEVDSTVPPTSTKSFSLHEQDVATECGAYVGMPETRLLEERERVGETYPGQMVFAGWVRIPE